MSKLQQYKNFVKSATARLALSYLAIIMLMSIGFSVVFYNTSIRELGRQGPPPSLFEDRGGPQGTNGNGSRDTRRQEIEDFLQTRIAEARQSLLMRLIYLNLFALLAGSGLSYFLARRTLLPIEENMEAQAQFVSDASHELRTPLTALQTTTEVALRKPKLSEAEARDLLGYNVAEVAKLKALTDGLLKLAHQDNHEGTSKPHTPISLQEIANEAMNAVIPAAQAKKISIDDRVAPIKVLGDQTTLTQVVIILLDNAIKYSHPGFKIELTSAKHSKHASLIIRDEGQGIATKDLPHIFDRFYRADQSRGKQKVDGYGIGLALAKKIIHQQNGEIIASSIEGKGSTFTIKLPLA